MKTIDALDAYATSSINALSGHIPWLDGVMVVVTHIGVPLLELAVIANWWLRGGIQSERHAVIACGLSFLLGLTLNQIIALMMITRPRPYDIGITHLLVAPSLGPSFPAGHATMAFAIAFTYFFGGRFRKAAGFMTSAICIAFSHIYVGAEYVSDIAGGIATGCIAAGLTGLLYRENTRFDQMITKFL